MRSRLSKHESLIFHLFLSLFYFSNIVTKALELTASSTTIKRETVMALVALFADLVIVAFLPILIKISESEISPNAAIFNRLWISTVVLGLWNGLSIFKRQWSGNALSVKPLPDKRFLFLLLPMLIVFSGGYHLLYAWSLTQTTVANSEVLHSLTPIFITLAGWILFKQQFESRFLLGIAIAICGSIALVANDFSITIDKLQGDGLAFISAILWGWYLLVLEKLQTQLSTNAIITLNFLLETVLVFPILLVFGDDLFPHSWQIWLVVVAMGTIGIFTKILIIYSLKYLSSGLVATILLLHPVVTAILAWGIFSETLSLLNLLALVIVLLGVYLATSSKAGIKTEEE